jgi:hypothetical protein
VPCTAKAHLLLPCSLLYVACDNCRQDCKAFILRTHTYTHHGTPAACPTPLPSYLPS